MKKNDRPLGLYLHIPFCRRKCRYCDFCSAPPSDRSAPDAYVERLCRELTARTDLVAGRTVDTVYFGGGTPTLLAPEQLARLLDTVRDRYVVAPDAEITLECNPATADAAGLAALRAAGFNRISIGAQSAEDSELAALGRIHTFADTAGTVAAARAAGFDDLSLDLMYGIPHQTRDTFAATLDRFLALNPTHLSAYSLILEPGTPFWEQRDTLPLPDEDAVCDMTDHALTALRRAGFERYEISNFARPGRASRHNLHYWQMDDYVGVGIAAHSLVGGVRYQNRPDLAAYLGGEDVTEIEETLTEQHLISETLMLGLRLSAGIDRASFAARFGFDPADPSVPRYAEPLTRFAALGLVRVTPRAIALTDRGMAVSNSILAELV